MKIKCEYTGIEYDEKFMFRTSDNVPVMIDIYNKALMTLKRGCFSYEDLKSALDLKQTLLKAIHKLVLHIRRYSEDIEDEMSRIIEIENIESIALDRKHACFRTDFEHIEFINSYLDSVEELVGLANEVNNNESADRDKLVAQYIKSNHILI